MTRRRSFLLWRILGYRVHSLATHEERCAFLEAYLEAAGLPHDRAKVESVAAENLVHSHVVSLTRGRSLIGGFAFGPSHKSRWPTYITAEALASIPFSIEHCLDLNFVFLERKHRGRIHAFVLWLIISRVLGHSHVERILYLTDAENKGLIRLYEKVSAGVVGSFEMTGFKNQQIMFWSTPQKFRAIPRMYWQELFARVLGRG